MGIKIAPVRRIARIAAPAVAAAALGAHAPAAALPLLTESSGDDVMRVVNSDTGLVVSSVPMTLAGETVGWANGLAQHPVTGDFYALPTLRPPGFPPIREL